MADADKADAENTGAENTGAERAGTEQARAEQAGAEQAGTERAGTEQGGADEAGAMQAGAERAGAEQADAVQAGAEQAAGDQAGAEQTGAVKPAEDKPRARSRSKASAAQSGAPGSASGASRGASRSGASKATTAKGAAVSEGASGTASDGDGQAAREPAVSPGRARLKLHHLRPAPGARRDRIRVGRGEASKGKTAGRGTKGTKARDTVPAGFEGGQMPIHRRLPKLKGFSNSAFKTTYQVVNLDRLTALYPSGGSVTPDDLVAKGAVRKGQLVKILGTGEAGAKLQVTAHAFSGTAREKIAAAGGSVTEL